MTKQITELYYRTKAIDMHGHFGDYDRGASSLRDKLFSSSIDVVRAQKADMRLTAVSSLETLCPTVLIQ